MTLPAAVPELPVDTIDRASVYYVGALGFTLDWHDARSGIAGVSRGSCRLFLAEASFRRESGNGGPQVIWLNLTSKAAVDELFAEWKAAGAVIVSEPADKAWKLREFVAADPDRNQLRIFHDFGTAAADSDTPSVS